MKTNLRMMAAMSAGVMLAGAAGAALAQAQPPAPPSAEGWRAHAHQHGEARIHALHDLLNIRPDQDSAFQAFVAALRPPHPDADRGPQKDEPADIGHLTTPERLDRMAARMAERQAAFQARADATRRFYAALSPQQQRAFDALPMLGVGGEFGGHHPGPMGDHGPGDREGPEGPPPAPPGE